MKAKNWFLLFWGVLFLVGCGFKYVSITYKVVDEQGNPIQGANVNNHYFTGGGLGRTPTKDYDRNGVTNEDGIYTYRDLLPGIVGEISFITKKDGYYSSWDSVGPMEIYGKKKFKEQQKIITLYKKIRPIKMYAKNLKLNLPIQNGEIGYDLIVGDFVAPYGSGNTADFVFHVSPENKNHHLQNVTFSNPGDGIQPFYVKFHSSLYAGNNAPSTNYFSSWKEADEYGYMLHLQKGYQENSDRRGSPRYYFRVRTQEDGTAMYGFFTIQFNGIPYISIDYHLNPDKTTNIEYGGSYFPPPSNGDESYYLPIVPD